MKDLILLILVSAYFSACSTARIYIVRHGERLNSSDTTSISAAGQQRAQALADFMANKRIDAIFVSPYQRTRQTAQPTADRLNLALTEYQPRPTNLIASRLKTQKNKNSLVVGHSDTILEVAKWLETTPSLPKIEPTDFDNMLIVTIKRTLGRRRVSLQETTYGQPTPP